MYKGHIVDVGNIEVGHAQNMEARTGCTVLLCPQGLIAGVDVRGAAPGTRETDLLRPGNQVEKVQAIVLSGGSAFGLASADGVMGYLEVIGAGQKAGDYFVPIVPAAVLFDLENGDGSIRPDADMGYEACKNASMEPLQGRIGAGCGAMVGKVLGMERASAGGLGSASMILPGGIVVAAMVAVNALGEVRSLEAGEIIAGVKAGDGQGYLDACELIWQNASTSHAAGKNTTIGIVATNAKLDCSQANRMASIAHDGYARTIFPVHTLYDGDTIFALSTGEMEADLTAVYSAGAEVMARAIVNAVSQ